MKISCRWNRRCNLRLDDVLAIRFFGRLKRTPNSLHAGSGTEKRGQRNGRAARLVLVLPGGRIAMGAQVSRNLFQGRGTPAGALQLTILYMFDPRLDSRTAGWSRNVFLLQRLEQSQWGIEARGGEGIMKDSRRLGGSFWEGCSRGGRRSLDLGQE
jgi:hypothetical protein